MEEGYTTDDNAQALVVIARAINAGIDALGYPAQLDFVLAGQVAGGLLHPFRCLPAARMLTTLLGSISIDAASPGTVESMPWCYG